jgi:GNAT superfamily N-acetyltransferase
VRAPTRDDIPALAAHGRRVYEAERPDQLAGVELWEWLFDQATFHPEADKIVGVDADGTIVADAGSWAFIADTGSRAILWAETSPGWEHTRTDLLRWAEARGREQIGDTTAPRTLRVSAEEHRTGVRDAAEALGFEATRTFVDMERDLQDLPAAPSLPDGVAVAPWPDDVELVRQTSNESFASHWGSLPMSAEEWESLYGSTGHVRPDLSFVAVDDNDTIVSFCMVTVDEEHDAETGVREAWLNRIGTVPGWQRKGIAATLIVRSLQAAKAAGFERAGLDVDESSATNATVLYERLGFTVRSRGLQYTKQI